MRLDLLLTHAYLICEDPHEQQIMRPFPPLGLQYLVAWMRRETSFAVDWFDTTFAPSIEALHTAIADQDPRVVGLYGHTITRPDALPAVTRWRADGRRVIAGGPDPIQYAEAYFDAGVEVIVIGEGEHTVQELVECLAANRWSWDWERLRTVQGILFRAPNGEMVRTAPRPLIRPLSSLPWPMREQRDLSGYFEAWRARHGETALSLNTSRGCPYRCTWCSKQVYGDTFRRRDVDDVIDEVIHLRETFNPDQLWFVDDVFSINRRWVLRFADAMVERGAAMPFYLIARPEAMDAEMLAALRRAGCYRIYISAESGSQHVLDAMDKKSTVADILRAGELTRAAGIELGVFVMLGYPGEELADVKRTTRMLRTLDPAVTLLSVAHPMRGTRFYDVVRDQVLEEERWGEDNGGRLRFQMRYPERFYSAAQRVIWTERDIRNKLAERRFDPEFLRLAVKYPLHRATLELLGRTPPPRSYRPVFS